MSVDQQLPNPQFDLRAHYDLMEQLDADVHNNVTLSDAEASTAMNLVRRMSAHGAVPHRVSLPCFGTGRHIPALLRAGVREIYGVDLSEACVAKARREFGGLPGVHLTCGDIRAVEVPTVDAVILLGNSYGDIIDLHQLRVLTEAMIKPLRRNGAMVMDYIGRNFLGRCLRHQSSTWMAMLHGRPVRDIRTPSFDPHTSVMTIRVVVEDAETGSVVARTAYQKRIQSPLKVSKMFELCGVATMPVGQAHALVPYYRDMDRATLGMIGAADWWLGRRMR